MIYFCIDVKISQEGIGEGLEEAAGIATEETDLVEACKTGFFTHFLSLLMEVDFSHIALSPRLGQRDPVDDDVGGGGRRSVVSR